MAALAAGALVRVLDGPPVLFVGTVVAGGAIAIGNVLLPPLIKRDFPDRSGLMMGVYTMAVSGAAAVAAGIAVPLADASDLGWRGSLGAWAVPAAVAALAWLPRTRGHTRPPASPAPGRSLLRDPLAWQLTIFFGLQSLSFYAVLGWLPSMYRDFGATPAVAGFLLSFSGLVQIPVSLVVPSLANRATHQVGYAVGGTALIGAGVAGVLLAPMAAPYLWVGLIGAGQGGVLRARSQPLRAAHRTGRRHRAGVGHGAEHRLHAVRVRSAARRAPARRDRFLDGPAGAAAGAARAAGRVRGARRAQPHRPGVINRIRVRRCGGGAGPGRAVSSRGSSSGACRRAQGDSTLSGACAAARNASQSHHTHSATSSGAGAGSPSRRQT